MHERHERKIAVASHLLLELVDPGPGGIRVRGTAYGSILPILVALSFVAGGGGAEGEAVGVDEELCMCKRSFVEHGRELARVLVASMEWVGRREGGV